MARLGGKRSGKTYPTKVKVEARRLFLEGGYTRDEIADRLQMEFSTLCEWVRVGKWVREREQLVHDLNEKVTADVRKTIQDNLAQAVKDHIKWSRDLQAEISGLIEEKGTNEAAKESRADRLLKAARILKATADVEARVLGLDRRSAIDAPKIGAALILQNPRFILPGGEEQGPMSGLIPEGQVLEAEAHESSSELPGTLDPLEDAPDEF